MGKGKIYIVGISPGERLSGRAEKALLECEKVLSSARLNALLLETETPEEIRKKCMVMNKVDDTLEFLKGGDETVTVLASGDPMFFGIARRILEEARGREVEVIPALSSVQLAFAKIKEPWEDAFFVSLHGERERQWAPEDLGLLLERHGKLCVLTGGANTPARIASDIPEDARVFVLERLGYPDEAVTGGSAGDMREKEFAGPNLMIIMTIINAGHNALPVFGLKEGEFAHERGLITKDEVRAVVLHKLRLPARGVLWDIGAGSGSISIEARRLSPALKVYAIEKDAARVAHIKGNVKKLRPGHINVVEGEAPGVLSGLPRPDRVFVGGSGGGLPEMLRVVNGAMERGIIVAAAVTLETLNEAVSFFRGSGMQFEVASVSVARSEQAGEKSYMKAQNTVFLIKAER